MTPPCMSDLPVSMKDTVLKIGVALLEGKPVLLSGPPGVGKTMLARRFAGIVAPNPVAFAELKAIYRLAGMNVEPTEAPFRAPHHTISGSALAGRGACEAELARYGILFLDEVSEFSLGTIEFLRHKLRDMLPDEGRPLLIMAANPCSCGWHGSELRVCSCSPFSLQKYRDRLNKVVEKLTDGKHLEVTLTPVAADDFRQGPRLPETHIMLMAMRHLEISDGK